MSGKIAIFDDFLKSKSNSIITKTGLSAHYSTISRGTGAFLSCCSGVISAWTVSLHRNKRHPNYCHNTTPQHNITDGYRAQKNIWFPEMTRHIHMSADTRELLTSKTLPPCFRFCASSELEVFSWYSIDLGWLIWRRCHFLWTSWLCHYLLEAQWPPQQNLLWLWSWVGSAFVSNTELVHIFLHSW